MTEQAEDIKLGTGVGELRFGMSMDEVRQQLGEPEEVEKSEEDDDFEHQAWNYLDQGYSLYFDREDDYRLSCIETDRPAIALYGESILGKSPEQIKALMAQHGHTNADEEAGDDGELQLSYEHQMIDFYFVENELMVVNFGVFIEEESLEVRWPD
jgi:hypothetical protein